MNYLEEPSKEWTTEDLQELAMELESDSDVQQIKDRIDAEEMTSMLEKWNEFKKKVFVKLRNGQGTERIICTYDDKVVSYFEQIFDKNKQTTSNSLSQYLHLSQNATHLHQLTVKHQTLMMSSANQ